MASSLEDKRDFTEYISGGADLNISRRTASSRYSRCLTHAKPPCHDSGARALYAGEQIPLSFVFPGNIALNASIGYMKVHTSTVYRTGWCTDWNRPQVCFTHRTNLHQCIKICSNVQVEPGSGMAVLVIGALLLSKLRRSNIPMLLLHVPISGRLNIMEVSQHNRQSARPVLSCQKGQRKVFVNFGSALFSAFQLQSLLPTIFLFHDPRGAPAPAP
jgi:hypothetical protein